MTDAQKCLILTMVLSFLSLSFFKGTIIRRHSRNNITIRLTKLTQHQESFSKRNLEKLVDENGTNETCLCNNVVAPRKNLSLVWQPIIPDHSYIYSAHIDNRDDRKMIKVFTIIEVKMAENFNLYCHVWYENASHVIAVKAEPEPKVGSGDYK